MPMKEHLPLSSVTPTIRVAGLERDGHDLVELFAENTKLGPHNLRAHQYRIIPHLRGEAAVRAGANGYKVYLDAPTRALPDVAEKQVERQSAKRFAMWEDGHRKAVERAIAEALHRNRIRPAGAWDDIVYALGRYPSAGALFPVEHYLLLPDRQTTVFDIWYVDARHGRLSQIQPSIDSARVLKALVTDNTRIGTPAAIILQTVLHQRSTAKYGARGYRFALTEVGCATQCILEAATSEGLASLCWGGYLDDAINTLLGVDGVDETAIGCILLGAPEDTSQSS